LVLLLLLLFLLLFLLVPVVVVVVAVVAMGWLWLWGTTVQYTGQTESAGGIRTDSNRAPVHSRSDPAKG
jgi:ABC-type transporter Mla subunit MlaD